MRTWVLTTLAAGCALAGWIVLEAGRIGLGIAIFSGAFVALGAFGSLVRCLDEPGPLARGVDRMRRRPPPVPQPLLSTPGRPAWLLPLALAPAMAATLPLAFHTAPGDWSILGVLAVFVLLIGYGGLVVGVVVWAMVLFPLLLLVRVRHDRFAVGLAVLMLSVVTFTAAVVLATPATGAAGRPWLIWVARAAVVAIVAGVVLTKRGMRDRPGWH